MPSPAISAIVVNYRRPDILADLPQVAERRLARVDEPTEMLVVDNASGDRSCAVVAEETPGARLLVMPENLGFAAVSKGIEASTGEWLLLVNNDVEVEPDAVRDLLEAGRSAPRIGSVAAQMRFASDRDTINSAGIGVDRLGIAYDRLLGEPAAASETEPVDVFGASGGAALYRRAMLEDIGGFDESFFFVLEDADVAWRAQMRGWRCRYVPQAVVHHHHGATMPHGSSVKYFQVGLNRVRTLAKNAEAGQLRRHGLAMIGYDTAYVGFAAVKDRTLAPLRGRLAGLRQWRTYRRAGAELRGPVELAPTRGLRAALGRRAAWQGSSAALQTNGSHPAPGAGHLDPGGENMVTRLESRLEGPVLLQPVVHGDHRGFFQETYRKNVFAEHGIHDDFVQDNHSRSSRGIVRGMHFQVGDGMAKLVRCRARGHRRRGGGPEARVADLRRVGGVRARRREFPPALLPGGLRARLLRHERGRRRDVQVLGRTTTSRSSAGSSTTIRRSASAGPTSS